jgi:predicted ester cyclase
MRPSLLASLVLCAACGSAAVDQPGPAPVDPRLFQDAGLRAIHKRTTEDVVREERAAVLAVFTGYGHDGFAEAIPKLDVEGDLSFPGVPDATNREGALKELGELFGPFSQRAFTVGREWDAPSVVITEWSMTGVHSGVYMGVAPTQKPVSIKGLAIFWFDQQGMIVNTHLFFDVGAVLAELGKAPKGIEPPVPPAAGAAPSPAVTATGSDDEKKNLATINASWDSFEAKKEAGYLAPLSGDIDVFRLDRAAPEHGKAERKKFFKWAAGGIASLSQTPTNAWAIGPFVIEEYTLEGVQSGPLTDAPNSGHALRLHYCDIDEFANGEVVRTWTYGNSLELYAEIGQVPLAAPGGSAMVSK